MDKIVFLILHYYTIEDTEKCVKSIIDNNKNINYEIVIVDNASSNGTGKILEEKYKNQNNIHVILNETNLGFAKGNNIGFKFAKEKLNADFIVMLNNDTLILQDDFSTRVINEYKKNKYGVLGPKIILKNNVVNSLYLNLPTYTQIKYKIIKMQLEYIVTYLYIDKLYFYLKSIIKKIFKRGQKEEKVQDIKQENIILHGCFLIFSPIYIEKFNGIDDRTFLFCEEELLYIRLMKNNMKSIYNPEIEIYHDEESSIGAITKRKRKKELFMYKNLIKSNKILLKELKNINL